MITYMLNNLKMIGVIGVCSFAAFGCGSGANAIDKASQKTRQKQIVQVLASSHEAGKFMCLRLPPHGVEVVLVVTASKEISAADLLLRRYKIDGSTEVKTPYEYNIHVRRLAESIESQRPKTRAFSSASVSYEILHTPDTSICPKANIELGPKGSVSPSVFLWARRVVGRYGSDWVNYGYTPIAEAPLPTVTVRQ